MEDKIDNLIKRLKVAHKYWEHSQNDKAKLDEIKAKAQPLIEEMVSLGESKFFAETILFEGKEIPERKPDFPWYLDLAQGRAKIIDNKFTYIEDNE